MIKEIKDKAETTLAYLIVFLMFAGFPLFLFFHAVMTVAE